MKFHLSIRGCASCVNGDEGVPAYQYNEDGACAGCSRNPDHKDEYEYEAKRPTRCSLCKSKDTRATSTPISLSAGIWRQYICEDCHHEQLYKFEEDENEKEKA